MRFARKNWLNSGGNQIWLCAPKPHGTREKRACNGFRLQWPSRGVSNANGGAGLCPSPRPQREECSPKPAIACFAANAAPCPATRPCCVQHASFAEEMELFSRVHSGGLRKEPEDAFHGAPAKEERPQDVSCGATRPPGLNTTPRPPCADRENCTEYQDDIKKIFPLVQRGC